MLISKTMSAQRFEKDTGNKYIVEDPKYEAPHLKLGVGDIHPVVVTVGDPFRCDLVAQ